MRIKSLALVCGLLAASVALAAPSQSEIRAVKISGSSDGARVVIDGAFKTPRYSVRSQAEGRVIVIEVQGAKLPSGGVHTEGRNSLVASTIASTTAHGARIEVALARPVTYRARATDERIQIDIERRRADDGSAGADVAGASIRKVRVEPGDGRDRVIIELSRAAPFRVSTRPGAPPRLEVIGGSVDGATPASTKGPEKSSVDAVRVFAEKDRAVVEVDGNGSPSGSAIRSGKRIIWLFTHDPKQDARPPTRTIAREVDRETIESPEVAGFLTDLPPVQLADGAPKRFTGRRIDLDFKDADIHNILRLLSDVGEVNVITADNVSGSVTIRMRDVPWDQALSVILQAKGLGMVWQDNLIRVAPREALEREREAEIARIKQQSQLAPLETRLVPVSYADATDLSPRVKELLTDRGKVSVDNRTNTLVVRDIADRLRDVEDLVRSLDTQTPQVLIEARIVEASSQYSRDVGIQWGGDVTFASTTGNPTGLSFPSNVSIAGGSTLGDTPVAGLSPFSAGFSQPNFLVNLPAAVGSGAGGALGIALGSLSGNVNLNVRLSAAESSGNVRIISSPRILTLNNNEASIEQGTLIPFSRVSSQGVNTAFQEAKLSLSVRPHVTSDGAISLGVNITRDEPDFGRTGAGGDPTILKRGAKTELLIPDGNTAVIGGIYTRNTGRNLEQVPFFGDIPVLGVLFRKRTFREDRNELLIFLTPRIVNRSESLIR